MKNTMKIFSLLILLLCTVLLASCGDAISVKSVQADPYEAIMDASEDQLEAMAAKLSGLEQALEAITEKTATYELKVELPEDPSVAIEEIFAEFVVDSEADTYSGEAGIGPKGAQVTGQIWGDKDQLALSVPMLLGDGAYGLNFDTFMEDLENSSTLAAFGLSWADLKAQLGLDLDSILDKATDKDMEAIFEEYQAECEAIMEELTPVVAEETVDGVETITVTYTFTKEAMVKCVEAVEKYTRAIMGDLMELASEVEFNMDLENMPEGGTYKCYLAKKTGEILKIDLDMDGIKGTINYSTDAARPMDMSFDFTMPVEGGLTGTFRGTLREVAEEGKSGLIYDFDIAIDGESTPMTLSYIRNDADGKYEMKLAIADEAEMSIGGELTYSATEIRFTVDKINVTGEDVGVKVTFTARAGGTVEAMPAYKNALMLTTEDLLEIMKNFQ